jgi:tetratricopeptide (TPR) repeat protein
LNTLGYENYRILIENIGEQNLAVILSGRENEFLINDMKEILANVDQQYGNILRDWDGNAKQIEEVDNIIEKLITSGKYDGIDYAKDNPQIKRNRLFENILLGIERQTKVNPSLICIEDLQWADPSSLALMHYVARYTRKCKLLILGTYRPEDVSSAKEGEVHPLIHAMQMMSHEDLLQKVELERLNEDKMNEMITEFFTKTDFPSEFRSQVYKETEGNPFFIISLLRMLIDEEKIIYKNEVWTLSKLLKDLRLPSKVYDVIIRRLYRVREKDRELLDCASIIGEEFQSDLLAHATQTNKLDLLKRLRDLEQNHRMIRSFESKFKFDHGKIKEVLNNQIPLELKKEYHAVIGQSIEELNKDKLDMVFGKLAFHYYNGQVNERALIYLLKAADRAKSEYSNEEALKFYTQALEFEKGPLKRSIIFEKNGDIYNLIGDFDKSIESFDYALGLSEQKERKAGIKVKIGENFRRKGDYVESIKICNEALDLVKDNLIKEEAQALSTIANTHLWRGEEEKALEYYKRSLVIMNKIGDQNGIADILNGFGIIYADRAEIDNALMEFEKSLDIRRNIGDLQGITKSLLNAGALYCFIEENDKALEYFKEALDILKKIGDMYLMGFALYDIADMHLTKEDYDEAITYFKKSLEINVKYRIRRSVTVNYCGLAEAYFEKGDMDQAIHFCNMASDLSKEIGTNENLAKSKRIYGMIYREQKKWEESIENFKESIRIINEIKMEREMGKLYYEFGLMWKKKGEEDKAKEYFTKALELFKKMKQEKQIEKVKMELQTCQ